MEINKCKKKLKLLFDKFFEENFELSSYYSENLLKYLDDGDDKCAGKLLDTPFFSDLIMYSVLNLEKASMSVKVFIFEMFAIALKNELQFSKLSALQGFRVIAEKLNHLRTPSLPTALHLAGLRSVTAYTSHYSGLLYMINLKLWSRAVTPATHLGTARVSRASYNFISKLVWKLNEYDEEEALIEVLEYIVNPIKASQYLTNEAIDVENENSLYEPILSYINALVAIVKDCENNESPNRVSQLLYRHFIIDVPFHLIVEKTRNIELVYLLCEFHIYYILALCKDYLCSDEHDSDDRDIPTEIISVYYNIINVLVNKRMPSAVMFYVVKCALIWAKMETSMFPVTFERHGRIFNFQNQFITLVLAPLLTYTRIVGSTRNNTELLEETDVYSIKVTKMSSELILKAVSSIKDLMERSDSKKVVIQCLREILKLRYCLNLAQAGLLYQALFYTLKLHVISDGSGAIILNENPLKTPDDIKLISLAFEAIKMLLKEHDLNWYENVEIISLQTVLMDLLKQNCMPTKQLLQAVDLIDLSIKKFLSPDMALLMESKRGSTLNEVGAIMKSYMEHEEWEVRDSALQLLLSCTEVAYVEYLPLRKLISENRLTIRAVHVALSDAEFYVQTTALRCLAAATKIESIWREMLIAHPSLYIQLIYIMEHNPEGIVRKEAANVLTEVYVNQKLDKDFTRRLYNVMATAALNELHWEVQVAALKFWKNAILNLLSNRGMIDGIFPSVTFSKEKRKIIVLNENEIMKQLLGIMNELSTIGCLTVLYKCLNEESNIEVMEQAYYIAKELVRILDYYKFEVVPDETMCISVSMNTHNSEDIGENVDEALDLTIAPPRDEIELREQIIETIINATDYDLIKECYENYRLIKTEPMDEDIAPSQLTNLIDSNTFIKNFKVIDHLSILKHKKNWISGPSSLNMLLDDILSLGKAKTDIEQDCD